MEAGFLTTLAPSSAERRVVLSGISWALYQDMLAEIGDGHTRLTYDQGRLEIMSRPTCTSASRRSPAA
jgi:hypothetical protein